MDYKPTICLPKTDFPMKADLPRREPEIRKRWSSLYADLRKARARQPGESEEDYNKRRFTFHDGPPYANGDVHIGTVLNKVLKDFIVRSRNMMGKDAPFVPGWDCHGLPIEHKVLKEALAEAKDLLPAEIRKRCRDMAEFYVAQQRDQYVRLGIEADWEGRYLTMNPAYEDGVLWAFQELYEKGLVTRDKRSTAWCPNCATALAEAELEYHDRESPSVYVRCMVHKWSPALQNAPTGNVGFIIWTTTPWTLPANRAIAVHPQLDYTVFSADMKSLPQRNFIVASRLLERVTKTCGLSEVKQILTVKGADLVGTSYRHPLTGSGMLGDGFPLTGGPDLMSQSVVPALYVSAEDGTGCVHTAPGHGADDFRTGKENNLPPFSPLDDHGHYTSEVGPTLVGKRVHDEANKAVVAMLDKQLVHQGTITHSYAHCWRCKGPIIFRATDQWFIKMDQPIEGKSGKTLRQKAKEAIGETRWVPEWGSRRIGGMVETRPDWCISRQRHWGIPIPAVVCGNCGKTWTSPGFIRNTRKVVAKDGADAWFKGKPAATFIGSERCPDCRSTEGALARDIFDVWFESGTSWRAVVQREEHGLHFPSDVVIEGTDQHRGWFQLSLLPSVALEGRAPWKTVVTNGFTVDDAGEKVSKSKGGLLHANELADKFGADVARLWVASINYHDDIPVSHDLLQKVGESYRRIRNTFRWLLGNLHGFDPVRDAVPDGDLLEADRWALARLDGVVAVSRKAWEDYDFARGTRMVYDFCDQDLSAFWFDFNKDRFYCDAPNGLRRRSGQTACLRVADALCRLLAPVLVHTTEEVWAHLPGERETSVHLETWPEENPTLAVDALSIGVKWESLRTIRGVVASKCEQLRANKQIGSNQEASVRIRPQNLYSGELLANSDPEELAELLIVSEVKTDHLDESRADPGPVVVEVEAMPSPHHKCARCWNLRPTVGKTSDFPDLCARCVDVVRDWVKEHGPLAEKKA